MMALCSSSVRIHLSTWLGKFVADEWLVAFVSGSWLPMKENRTRALVPMFGPLTSADTFSMPVCSMRVELEPVLPKSSVCHWR